MNRRALLEYLENIIPTSSPESLALLCLDLEGLKKINCLFGYETGDSLLKQMAASLTAVVKDSGVVARIGDDEFAVLLKGFSTADEVIAVAKNIIQSHSELDKTIHKTSINLGIGFYPNDGNTAAILFNNTCKAMHFAKQEGCSLKHFQDI